MPTRRGAMKTRIQAGARVDSLVLTAPEQVRARPCCARSPPSSGSGPAPPWVSRITARLTQRRASTPNVPLPGSSVAVRGNASRGRNPATLYQLV